MHRERPISRRREPIDAEKRQVNLAIDADDAVGPDQDGDIEELPLRGRLQHPDHRVDAERPTIAASVAPPMASPAPLSPSTATAACG